MTWTVKSVVDGGDGVAVGDGAEDGFGDGYWEVVNQMMEEVLT